MIGAPTPLSACNPTGTVVRRGAARGGSRHGKRQRASPARRHGPARRPTEGPARSPRSGNGRSVMRASAELNRAASAGMNQHTAGRRCGSARLGSGTHPNARLLATVQMVTALYGAVTVLDAPDAAGTPRSGGTDQTRSRADPERCSAVAGEAAAGAAPMAPAATTGPVGAPVGDPAGGSIDTASRAAGPKRATRLALSDSVTGACAEIRLTAMGRPRGGSAKARAFCRTASAAEPPAPRSCAPCRCPSSPSTRLGHWSR